VRCVKKMQNASQNLLNARMEDVNVRMDTMKDNTKTVFLKIKVSISYGNKI